MFSLRSRPTTRLAALAALALVPAAQAQTPAPGVPAFQSMRPVAMSAAAVGAGAPSEARALPERAWVFVDCPSGIAAPLSAAAAARRRLRGTVTSDELLDPACRAALVAAGAEVRAESRWLSAYSVALPTAEIAARVAALPFVRGAGPVRTLAPTAAAARPGPLASTAPPTALALALDYGASRAQLAQLNVPAVHDAGLSGRGVRLGWLDTEYGGFAHPVFAAMVSGGRLGGTRSFAAPQSDRHGLNTSSIAVGYAPGQLIGPAYGATLFAATTEFAPTERNAEEDAFVAGLEWLESNGVDAVNVSLGYIDFDAGQRSYTYADFNGDTAVTTRAADAAASRGVVMVVSAGNEGGCSGPSGGCPYYIGSPADGDSVIAVGATTLTGAKASFSSFGPTSDGRIKPDVSAPGAGVTVATGASTYGTTNGTSFSAPLVTGVVALMLEANPALTPIQVRTALRQTASQASSPDNRLGWGIVNAAEAVRVGRTLVGAPMADAAAALVVRIASNGSAAPSLLFDRTVTVEVADLLGRVVRRSASASRVDLSGLAAGVYAYAARDLAAGGAAVVRGTAVVGR